MKNLFTLALSAVLLSAPLSATVVYNDFAPDLSMSFGSTLSFDLDGDMNDDITFSTTGTGNGDYVINVSGSNLEFAAEQNGNYTENLFIGKLVNASKNWVANSIKLASAANKDIAGGNEFFIGVRVAGSNNNFFYGWILVELKSNLELVVKSTAFETSQPQIVVGNTGAALLSEEEFTATEWSLFPTAVNDFLKIEASEDLSQVIVYKSNGAMVLNQSLASKTANLDLAHLPKGIYIIKAVTAKGSRLEERFTKL